MLLLDLLPDEPKQPLNQGRQQPVAVQEVREGVEDFLAHELGPLLLEFRRQAKRTTRVVLVGRVLGNQLL